MVPPPPPLKGIGGIDVPPRNWGPMIEDHRRQFQSELDRYGTAILILEKRVSEIENGIGELRDGLERLNLSLDELADGQRPSRIDSEFEAKVLAALAKSKSTPPDVEMKVGDRSVRGRWWVVIGLALCLVLFAALWQGPELIDAMRGK